MTRSAAEAYKTQAIMTAGPAKLVAMCFDRTIGALKDSIRAMEAGDIQARCDHSTRAANIVAHLWSTLDLEKGGEIAENLSNIYGFVMGRLPDINLHNDAQAAHDIISVLLPLSQSWNELADKGAPQASAQAAGAGYGGARPQPTRSGEQTQKAPARPGGIAISI